MLSSYWRYPLSIMRLNWKKGHAFCYWVRTVDTYTWTKFVFEIFITCMSFFLYTAISKRYMKMKEAAMLCVSSPKHIFRSPLRWWMLWVHKQNVPNPWCHRESMQTNQNIHSEGFFVSITPSIHNSLHYLIDFILVLSMFFMIE